MQRADVVLSMLDQKSRQNSAFVFDRLYRNLFNPDFFLVAYNTISAREGKMTAGAAEATNGGMRAAGTEQTIALLRQESYYPTPILRTRIPHKNGAQRSADTPSLRDALVQEVLRLILQAIYEPIFKDTSHGFRPNRSFHTALVQLKTTGRGANQVIAGGIKGFCENISHARLQELLARKISDGRFLQLIERFLQAGYMQFGQALNPLRPRAATAREAIIGPILANIYLHEFDAFMEQLCQRYSSTRITCTRYADDFALTLAGSRSVAEQVRDEIQAFLRQELCLELDLEKTAIVNLADQRARFLGYEIARSRPRASSSAHAPTVRKRTASETIQLLVPGEVIREQLKPFVRNGKAVHHNARLNLPLMDLLARYNAEIRSLYCYYCLATDVSAKIGKFKHYHYYSLLKTVARKEKCSVAQVISKYGVEVKLKQQTGTRKIFGLSRETGEGTETVTYFNDPIKRQDHPCEGNAASDIRLYSPRWSSSLRRSAPAGETSATLS
jgi:group II intron reverse transcriptase/maturase